VVKGGLAACLMITVNIVLNIKCMMTYLLPCVVSLVVFSFFDTNDFDRVYSELSEEMEGTHEQNECRKSSKTNFTSSVKRTKINWMSNGRKIWDHKRPLGSILDMKKKEEEEDLWIVMLFSIAVGYHCLGGPWCLHL